MTGCFFVFFDNVFLVIYKKFSFIGKYIFDCDYR